MGLSQRIRIAWNAIKAIPFDGGGGGEQWVTNWRSPAQYPNTNINYALEAGPLTGSSLIMAAVNWTGTTLPEAPVQVLEKKSTKDLEPIDDHPLSDLLKHPTRYPIADGQTREYYAGELLWKAFAASWIIDGNAYFLKQRNAAGQLVQLWYEPHFNVRARWPDNGSEFISYYEINRNGRWFRVEVADIIHFRYGIDPNNPRFGLSPVGSVYREIFTDSERARYTSLILKNGGVIPWLLTPDGSGVAVNPQEIKDEWAYRTTGDNVGKPIVLSGAMKAQAIGMTPDKMLVDKASQIPEERIAAVIGIPAAVLGFGVGLDQTKVGATLRELREQAFESYIIPTYRLIAGELESQLLPEFGDVEGLTVAHDLSAVRVLQDDRNALYTRETLAYEKGLKMRGECRAALGLESTPEDEVYFVEPAITMMEEFGNRNEDDADDEAFGQSPDDSENQDDDSDNPDASKSLKARTDIGTDVEAIDWWERNARNGAGELIRAKQVA